MQVHRGRVLTKKISGDFFRRKLNQIFKANLIVKIMISRFPNRKFKSIWWMPRFYMAMKDARGGDTLRGGAYNL